MVTEKYQRILVPLDGSQQAEIVLPYVTGLMNRFGPEVHLLHVCDAGHGASLFMCQSYVERVAELISRRAGAAPGVKTNAITGDAAGGILDYARETGADLVLIASHGNSGRQWLLGGVALKVLSASKVPVLLVRKPLPEKPSGPKWPSVIIVPLDGSLTSEYVLPFVDAFARHDSELAIVLLRVCEPPDLLTDYPEAVMPHTWDKHVKLSRENAEKTCAVYLTGKQESLKDAGARVKVEVALGDRPTDSIIDRAAKDPLALIAMTTHGASGISRWPYGHVADRILLATENPLLLVRPPKPER